MRKILSAVLAALLLGGLGSGTAAAQQKVADKPKRLLVISESQGFRHGCVTRKVALTAEVDPKNPPKVEGLEIRVGKPGKDGKVKVEGLYHDRLGAAPIEVKDGGKVLAKVTPCVVEVTFHELAKKHGFEVVCSQNSRKELTAENLRAFDAVFFYTTGTLPISDTQKADLLSFIRSGKGFAGSHCATDTFYGWKEYGELIGGYFDGHPWHEKINVIVEDKKHPATKHLGDSFYITDEIYQFKGPYSRDNLRILMRMDMGSVKNQGKRKDGDNALAWVREYGKGRVFYTALGHRDEVWRDARFQDHVVGGLRYVFRQEDADATPSGAKKN